MTKPSVAKKASSTKHDKPSGAVKGVKLTSSQQKILNYATKLTLESDDGPEIPREDLALEVNLNPRSMTNQFPKLRDANLIIVSGKTIKVTELGMELAQTDELVSAAPTNNDEHQQKLMDKYKLKGSQQKVINELKDGSVQSKEELADKLGVGIRSFTNLLTDPKKAGLLEVNGKNVRLTDKMFIKKLGRPCEK